uniref:ATP synthase F0 subunit 8 n=1 Tax=Pseudocuneopsis sichuanensis TaxID=2856829 RepID=UPI0021CC63F1|nr:ATP synthase F0 subunit 8 [Pseudocuneopsis sichuanensis]UWM10785.1 ATP synthase F0 subunit 8 [Pseudocuneopsis sichuanensis]
MPQLSPMSWVLVIGVFLTCLVCFAAVAWWVIESKYVVKNMGNDKKIINGKKGVKWGFGSLN